MTTSWPWRRRPVAGVSRREYQQVLAGPPQLGLAAADPKDPDLGPGGNS
jgi:hypothetical protein